MSRRVGRGSAVLLVVAAETLCVSLASGATPAVDVAAADKLYEAGKAAMDRGELGAACSDFAESQRLDPAAGTLLNLGECEARSLKLATALAHYEAARALLPKGDYRLPFAEERIAALKPRVPRVTIRFRGEREGIRVECDGVLVKVAVLGTPLPLDPGPHHIVATRSGVTVASRDVTLRESDAKECELSADDGAAANASFQRTAGLVTLGAGGVSLGLGVVLGIVAKVTYDSASGTSNCPHGNASCNAAGVSDGQTAHAEAAASTGTVISGVALAALGFALV